MRYQCWHRTDVGKVREENEDTVIALPHKGIFAVCDGCGGKAGGQQASSIVARVLQEEGQRLIETFDDYRSEQDRELRTQILQQISRIYDHCSGEVWQSTQERPELSGMATTAVSLMLLDNSGFIGHVGDSRLYLVRRDKIYQLTEDHSFFQRLVNAGKLKPTDYDKFPYKHIISRSLGSEPTVQTDTLFVDLLPNDVYVLCSDGVSDLVKPVEILSIAHYDGPDKLADRLIELSLERGAPDNASVVVVHVDENAETDTRSMDFTARMALLGNIELFKLLTDQELAKVLRIVYEERYTHGQCIIEENQPGDCMYLVAEGEVIVSLKGTPLTVISEGGHFGELALVDHSPRSASGHAQGKVTVLRIAQTDFHTLTQQDAALSNKLLWAFLQGAAYRVRDLSTRLAVLEK